MITSHISTPGADDPDDLDRSRLDDLLRATLHRVWGFSDFRPLQREAMHAVLSSQDSVVVLPTGGGKSLCFQAPAVVDMEREGFGPANRGVALVVSPLISLMKDQVDGLRADGVEAAYLNSTLAPRERDAVLDNVRQGRCRLLYVSPERVVGEGSAALRRMLRQAGVRFVAIDEAHCISQWGHDFRPEYRQLGVLRDDFPGVSLHAFTATATERVRQDIVEELRLDHPAILVGSFDRPNLTYRVLRRGNLHRQLTDILARHDTESGIVYCTSRREVEALAAWLKEAGLRAAPYHAGLEDAVRSRHQEAFLDEQVDIIVATVAFGMGIDRSNVRFVVHAGAPRSLE
ncbi:MAG TPA: ATP-dependent DNA helicase RecQ, partial [Gemmatimonadaceae bacterium]|nr:ATP-dependent DNA helicase RecQ [Gemmatimonadaceae bacterium]